MKLFYRVQKAGPDNQQGSPPPAAATSEETGQPFEHETVADENNHTPSHNASPTNGPP